MVNMGRMCDNNQEEAVLSTDAHMSFIKTIGLRAFDGVQLVFLYRPNYYKNAWFAIKVKVNVVFSCVCFNRCQT